MIHVQQSPIYDPLSEKQLFLDIPYISSNWRAENQVSASNEEYSWEL